MTGARAPAFRRRGRPAAMGPRGWAYVVMAATAFQGCVGDPHSGDARLQIAWRVESSVPVGTPFRLELQVSEMDWRPRNGLRVSVKAASGADTLALPDPSGRGAGSYLLEGFVFPSAGTWVLTARATRPDGRWTERSVTVEVGNGD